MKNLFNVTCEIAIDAESEGDAMRQVFEFLTGDVSPNVNFLIHGAEKDENFTHLLDLRLNQTKTD